MRLSDITYPIYIEKDAALRTTMRFLIPKLKGVFRKEVASWSKAGRAVSSGGRTALELGRPVMKGTFKAARRGWAAAATPHRLLGKLRLEGWNKARNLARFPNPAFTGKAQAGARLGVPGEFQGGSFIPKMIKKPVSKSQRAMHSIAGKAQFMTGTVPLFAGLSAIGELGQKRYPITSPYMP